MGIDAYKISDQDYRLGVAEVIRSFSESPACQETSECETYLSLF